MQLIHFMEFLCLQHHWKICHKPFLIVLNEDYERRYEMRILHNPVNFACHVLHIHLCLVHWLLDNLVTNVGLNNHDCLADDLYNNILVEEIFIKFFKNWIGSY